VPVDVRPVRSRRDLNRFVKLPLRIYSNDDPYVPQPALERKRFLTAKHNLYFEHADVQLFLAQRDGEPVGRISAQIDHQYNAYHRSRQGHFGFFESIDGEEVSGALLDAAASWLGEHGMEQMLGPMDFTINDESGIVIEGHERSPMTRNPWQHPYYRDLLEGWGLEKAMDLFMWELEIADRAKVLPILDELADRLEPDHGIRVRHWDKKDLEREVKAFVEIYNAAWAENWGFCPINEREAQHTYKEIKPLLDTNWLMAAEKLGDGEIVGVALTFPDYNRMLIGLRGRLFPLGWAKALWRKRRIDRVRVGFLGVKPEYRHTGVAAGFYIEHFEMATKTPQTWGEMGWILETNEAMNKGMEAMGGRIVKRYRLYEKPLADGAGRGDQ
jgi:GNAT superfamily N-acetyltransferase